MIAKKTLLILGAGASMPYRFPSGVRLRELLINRTRWDDTFSDLGFIQRDVEDFIDAFSKSELYSIDAFLAIPHVFDRFAKLGKTAIARVLIEFEEPDHLREAFGDNVGHWYRYLWNQLERHWDRFEENQLRVVTFNYDRSLEWYLASALSVNASRDIGDALGKLRHFRIKHVYGQLGELDTAVDAQRNTRPFHTRTTCKEIQIAASGLRIMDERIEDQSMVDQIRQDILWAERICFLGFSYDRLNLARLSCNEIQDRLGKPGAPVLYGSTQGLKLAERNFAMRAFGGQFFEENFISADNEALLRSVGVLL